LLVAGFAGEVTPQAPMATKESTLSENQVQKAREAIGFLASLPVPCGSEPFGRQSAGKWLYRGS